MKGNAPGRTKKCHASREHGQGAAGEDIPSPLRRSIASGPEGSDIFLRSLLAVLISLHTSRVKIELVRERERKREEESPVGWPASAS